MKTFDLKAYQREYQRRYRAKYPERVKGYQKKHWEKHKERRKRELRDAYANGERYRHHLRNKFGVPLEWYAETLSAQGGKCAICSADKPGGRGVRFHVDHCHTTGKIRGLLCNACNHLLGMAKDSEAVLSSAIVYLQKARTPD